MRILYFSTLVTIIIDFVLWFIIHVSMSYICFKLPDRLFSDDHCLYRIRDWENNGNIYKDKLNIKKWKSMLPDGGNFFSKGFSKKNLMRNDNKYINQFIIETRRAELTHWLQIIPVPIFFLFNFWWVGIMMIIYSLLANIPCIIAQRYNRPRLIRYLKKSSIYK